MLPNRQLHLVLQLAIMWQMGLVTDEELSVFSAETQKSVHGIGSIGGAKQGGPGIGNLLSHSA